MLPLDTSVQSEYADGFVLDETEHNDISPYDPVHNILRAILNKDPEAEHGRMVRFSCFYKDHRYDIDWRNMPENARPIRFKHIERDSNGGQWISDPRIVKLEFGYQFTDTDGRNVQEVQELR